MIDSAAVRAAVEDDAAEVRNATCAGCGGTVFAVLLDDEEGAAVRRCTGCGGEHAMLDSADVLEGADLLPCACPCGGESFEVAVGYQVPADGEVRWVSVVLRCTADGQTGVYGDWAVDYAPSRQLLDLA